MSNNSTSSDKSFLSGAVNVATIAFVGYAIIDLTYKGLTWYYNRKECNRNITALCYHGYDKTHDSLQELSTTPTNLSDSSDTDQPDDQPVVLIAKQN